MTLFFSTHYLEEADHMAERVVIIDHGRIIADGTAQTLKSALTSDRIVIATHDEPAAAKAAEVATRIAGLNAVDLDTVTIRVRVSRADTCRCCTARLPPALSPRWVWRWASGRCGAESNSLPSRYAQRHPHNPRRW
jgi:ABC-type multidrug transport system ATPase subunit